MINLFFDVETTGKTPLNSELISLAMIATDENYNELGVFNEQCKPVGGRYLKNVFGKEVNQWPDPTGSNDPTIRNATDVHCILWSEAQYFQEPIDMYRKLWMFIDKLPKDKCKLVYHSNTQFDPKFLFYRAQVHAPKMYQKLVNMTYFYEPDPEHGECAHRLRYDDTMSMARKYIKNGSDALKMADKLQKIIDKNMAYITKERKYPAKPEQLTKWKEKVTQARNDLAILECNSVQLEGYSLDKICRSLDIPLKHHNALSDTEALIPIHKFLSQHL